MRQIYHVSGRLVSPLFILFLRLYTVLTGVERVRVLVINEHREVLLVRGVISDGKWSLSGGGVARGERSSAAAMRELMEETGIDAAEKDFEYLETLEKSNTPAPYNAPLFLLRTRRESLPDKPVNPWEIAEVGWFQMSKLPDSVSGLSEMVLNKYENII